MNSNEEAFAKKSNTLALARIVIAQVFAIYGLLNTHVALAASSSTGGNGQGLEWEEPLKKIQNSLSGPVANMIIILAIVITGAAFAFGEHGSGFKKILGIACGGAITLKAATFMGSLLGVGF